MANVLVNDLYLSDIADAIREKLDTEDTYKPSEMADAIDSISGGGSSLGTKSITANGTYNASSDSLDGYSQVTVNVSGSSPSGTKSITANGTGIDVAAYAYADVAVPNTYAAGDEGKVVSNGSLVAQTSDTVTTNATYDTTLINSLTVNVPSSGGTVSGTFSPESNLRSVTLSDCIGKSNILIYPTTPVAKIDAGRTHYGDLITASNGVRMVGSTNSGGTSWTLGLSTASSWDSTTGSITITAGTTANYGGYYASGMTYAYVAW